jgi:hypothetical protein
VEDAGPSDNVISIFEVRNRGDVIRLLDLIDRQLKRIDAIFDDVIAKCEEDKKRVDRARLQIVNSPAPLRGEEGPLGTEYRGQNNPLMFWDDEEEEESTEMTTVGELIGLPLSERVQNYLEAVWWCARAWHAGTLEEAENGDAFVKMIYDRLSPGEKGIADVLPTGLGY